LVRSHLALKASVRLSVATETNSLLVALEAHENGCPAILEYKRASNENVINEGLSRLADGPNMQK
jgi:hypothetical protein